MAWLTASEITGARLRYAGVDHTDFKEGAFSSDAELDAWIGQTLLPAVEGHIEGKCERDFDVDYPSGIPPEVKDIASRAIANMLQYMVMNKMGPLIRTSGPSGEIKLAIPEQEILTPGLLKLLAPFKRREPHVKSTDYGAIEE